MAGEVVRWEIGAKNAPALNHFYEDLFGWKVETSMPGYGMVAATGAGIGGGILQTEGDVPPYLTVYVAVDYLAASLAKAVSLGGTQVVGPMDMPDVASFAMFADPEGHMIGLFKGAIAAATCRIGRRHYLRCQTTLGVRARVCIVTARTICFT